MPDRLDINDSELPELQRPNPLLKTVAIIFTVILTLILGLIVGVGGWNTSRQNEVPRESLPPQTEDTVDQTEFRLNNGEYSCGKGSDDEIQSCCSQWANANQIMTPQCVGNWEVTTVDKCAWKCTITPDEELSVEQDTAF